MTSPAVPVARFPFAEADRCVLCGLCLPHCPTYRLSADENESPRGRISLMRALAAGALAAGPALAAHIDHCLGCRACERVCPSGVRYGRLLAAGRSLLRAQHPAGPWRRAGQALALAVASGPRLRRLAGRLLRAAQRVGITGLLRRLGRGRLPALRLAAALPAPVAPPRYERHYAARGPRRGRVALFLGCLARELDSAALDAAIRALTRLGFDVAIPPGQTCCGALHREAGDAAGAAALLARNAAAFADFQGEVLVTLVSGCGAALADAASAADAPLPVSVRDAAEFLAAVDLPPAVTLAPLECAVAVHDPCALRNVLRAERGVYRLLARIPGIRLAALPDNHLCCGGAGAYPLREPEMAERLRAAKLAHLDGLRPDLLVSANLGCALHLRAGLAERGRTLEIVHPVVLFERQLRDRA